MYMKLNAKSPIMIVSDASVQKDGQSGFAWVIAHDAAPLWRGLGLAPGPELDMYSGRAEAFGLYAAISFLQYYLSCYPHLRQKQTVSCYCDNSGVVLSLRQLHNPGPIRPNETTTDDRDIYLAIHETAQCCPQISFNYWHVKGHQDADHNHQLTVEEQHNVDCDKLAGQFVRDNHQRKTDLATPEFDVAAPHLLIQGRIICRRVISTMRTAAAAPAYWEYLCKRYTWTHSDITHIQWRTIKTLINSFPCNDQRRLVLFTHDKLALRASKFHPHLGSQLCPSCQREPEDRWHFLECQHPERRRLFSNLKNSLTVLTNKFALHPVIFTTFWLGLLTIRNDTPYPVISQELPPPLRATVTAQSRLGWDQLYHGRLSHLWEITIEKLNPHLKVSGRYIVIQLIKTIWAYILAIWKVRNHHLYQDNGRLSLPNYQQAVRNIYETRHQLPPEVQEALFHRPLEQMLEQSPAFLRSWIERSQRYIKQQLKAAQQRAKLKTQDIRSFFRPTQIANDLQPP